MAASSSAASASPGGGSVNPGAAVRSCVGSRPPGHHVATYNAGSLSKLAGCLLRAERGQLGLHYAPNRGLSTMMGTAIGKFVGLAYLADGQSGAARNAEDAAAASMLQATCHAGETGMSSDGWAFVSIKPRATSTAPQVATLLASELQAEGAVGRASNAKFGVAARRGQLFENGDLNGTSLGVIAVVCG